MLTASASTKAFVKELDSADTRLSNVLQTSLALGPALVPLGAQAVPIMAGLAAGTGAAAGAVGTLALAFTGMGDALGAVNDYKLAPTQANLEKMREELQGFSAEGASFVRFLSNAGEELSTLRLTAQDNMFPGMRDGIVDMLTLLPQFERIVATIAGTLGDLAADTGEAFTEGSWLEFFDYIEREARPTLEAMGATFGNFGTGLAEMMMAFDPLADDFSAGMVSMSESFERWASGLSESEDFAEFVSYIQRTGPDVMDTLGAIVDAFVAFTEAAAPVGAAVLPVIEGLADAFASVARSDAGPVLIGAAAGLSAVSRAVALYNAANGTALAGLLGGLSKRPKGALTGLKADAAALTAFGSGLDSWGQKAGTVTTTNERLRRSFGRLAFGGAAVGGLALMLSDLDDQAGLTNTTMLGLAGTLAGPWGAAAGAAVGFGMDVVDSNDDMWESLDRLGEAARDASMALKDQQEILRATREGFGDWSKDMELSVESNPFKWFLDQFSVDNFREVKNLVEGILGDSDVEEAAAEMELYARQINGVRESSLPAVEGQRALSEAARDQANAAREAAAANRREAAALMETANAALAAFDARTAYKQALADATRQAQKNTAGVDANTAAGRNNREALSQLAAAWNRQTEAAGATDAAQERARAAFTKTAVQMGVTREKAGNLAERLLAIPDDVETKADLDDAQAKNKTRSLTKDMLDLASPRLGLPPVSTDLPEGLRA
ncbi:hypothetical protein KLP28_01735 [Nocardioidaceae bacterium]|nr:hypothetical protein KLP28_01735 [Nocardioidaceae bacterium]